MEEPVDGLLTKGGLATVSRVRRVCAIDCDALNRMLHFLALHFLAPDGKWAVRSAISVQLFKAHERSDAHCERHPWSRARRCSPRRDFEWQATV